MITFSIIKNTLIDAGLRIVTILEFGMKSANECAPFGDDSCPLPNMSAIYADTSNIDDPIILGYMNNQQEAQPGEKRLYSLMSDGTLSFYAWLRADGTMSLGGEGNNLVRFTPLQSGINAKDQLIQTELEKIATAIGGLGGVYIPGMIETNISASEITEIKCI